MWWQHLLVSPLPSQSRPVAKVDIRQLSLSSSTLRPRSPEIYLCGATANFRHTPPFSILSPSKRASGLFSKVHSRPSLLRYFNLLRSDPYRIGGLKLPSPTTMFLRHLFSLLRTSCFVFLALLLAVVIVVPPLRSSLVTYHTTVTSGTEIPHEENLF